MANIYTDIKLFDAESYLANNPDLGEAGYTVENVAEHYVQYGADEGRAPNAWFDIDFYREQNADLAEVPAGELLLHFAKYGAAEGRNPSPAFGEGQTIAANLFLEYALANEDLMSAFGITAGATRLTDEQQAKVASHFFNYGVNEGREGGIADIIVDQQKALEAALEVYTAAVKAEEEAKDALGDLDEGEIATNLGNAVEALKTTAKSGDQSLLPDAFDDADATTQEKMVALAGDTLAKNVADAEKTVAELSKELKAAKAANDNYLAVAEAAQEAKAQADKDGEHFVVELKAAGLTVEAVVFDFSDDKYTLKIGEKVVATSDKGRLVVNEDAKIQIDGNDVDPASIKGFSAWLASAQAAIDAVKAVEKAETSLKTANGKAFEALEGATTVTAVVTAIEGGFVKEDLEDIGLADTGDIGELVVGGESAFTKLDAAKTALAKFETAVADWEEAKEQQATFDAAEKAVTDAEDAVTAAEEAFEGLGVNLVKDVATDGTVNDEEDEDQPIDLFVYSGEKLEGVANFDGDDLFYFGDKAAKLVKLDADFDVTKGKLGGAADVLEIFAQQDGANTVLYVEKVAFAGNSSNAVDENNKDFVKIELVGVNAEDLQFEDGFLTFA